MFLKRNIPGPGNRTRILSGGYPALPRLVIRLSRILSGREPEFEIIGEELRLRIWGRALS